jgi:glycine/D-amino acid oxidase-like deaminating enzyme
MTDVVVVGAGLLGASTAYELAIRGARVTVLEAEQPGAGASGSSFAWVNAQDKSPTSYFELNVAGIDAYRPLTERLGGDWIHPGGDLVVGSGAGAAPAEERIARHEALGYPVRRLDRDGLAALEPSIEPGAGELVVGHFPDEAWLDIPMLIGRLLSAAREPGAVVRPSTPVERLEVEGGRVVGVVCGAERLTADRVLLAAGNGSASLAGGVGVPLPMAPSPGLLAITGPTSTGIRHVLHTGDVALRPDGGGRLMLQSRTVDATLERETRDVSPDSASASELLARAAAVVPAIRAAGIESTRVGIRAVAVDGQPTIGFAPDIEGLYILVSHSGATLGALLGRLVADELLGRTADRLEPFRPARFAAATA